MTPRILVVAGSDSGGGAGIQADIRTITMLGGHAMTAVTAITAQNTRGVSRIHPVPADIVVAQMHAVIDDIGVDAVKIGMIGSAETAHAVAEVLEHLCSREGANPGSAPAFAGAHTTLPIVLDPVMVATSGATLADDATIAALTRLMRLATIVTPNLPELDALGGEGAILSHGALLLAKGGHAGGATITDRLIGPDGEVARWSAPRIDTRHTHGTGCTLASAIAEGLGRGMDLPAAIARARLFVRLALHQAPGFGGGHGPMGHHEVRLDTPAAPTINQVTLPATDHAASRAFYTALGLTPIVDARGEYARFESAGGTTLSIHAAAAATVFIEVPDLDAAVAAARAQGITVADPIDQDWGWREARLCDPAGNALCLYTAGEHRRFPPWRLA
ncbi:phosphomethylpyrimidine kinase [Sphingomonas sp. Leaf412]|uniref:bifunctional hydroxymethylpyrimidine kinase/phosphomethylpyrimidine kinase n=1 Tax=Sphingomonas sp. Leaf412 TaxID=1736370 RepID=UPI0006F4952F|nr:bifunctional hydroxymethylpyrimidine kinase/phosphomethylpyrimidine kinase [Sphingomonas sp. Leaf412]KQT31893.1 phosphomethylpyrimidine kinase [Sphingomonas sp. Leaf412]